MSRTQHTKRAKRTHSFVPEATNHHTLSPQRKIAGPIYTRHSRPLSGSQTHLPSLSVAVSVSRARVAPPSLCCCKALLLSKANGLCSAPCPASPCGRDRAWRLGASTRSSCPVCSSSAVLFRMLPRLRRLATNTGALVEVSAPGSEAESGPRSMARRLELRALSRVIVESLGK